MSRRLNKVMVATVFVVAFFSLIPLSSGANFNDVKQARVTISIEIPATAPSSTAPVLDVLNPAPIHAFTPPVEKPSPGDPPKQPDPPVVVQPTPPAPPASDPPVAPVPPAQPDPPVIVQPVAPPVVQPTPPSEPIVITDPPQDTQKSPAIIDPEGSSNEEVSP